MPLPLNLQQDLKDRLQQEASQAAYDQVIGPLDRGEFRELTDQEWKDLVDGGRKGLPRSSLGRAKLLQP
jgi:hypothetical protein